jgi:hypothetical protein
MTEGLLFGLTTAWGIIGWLFYFRERDRSRDYATDLSQILYDYPEAETSLRRATNWKEINDRVNDD